MALTRVSGAQRSQYFRPTDGCKYASTTPLAKLQHLLPAPPILLISTGEIVSIIFYIS